jgi:signal transduction histidine kinase
VRTTIRLRLTLSQVAVFAVMATLLVAGTYALTARSLNEQTSDPRSRVEQALGLPAGTLLGDRGSNLPALPVSRPPSRRTLRDVAAAVQQQTRSELLRNLLTSSAALVVVATLLTFVTSWLLARRSLRPLRQITSRAKTISVSDLSEPIGLVGPKDELRELADTFDEMLARLDRAFSSQRLFAANASHELRTPLTRIRTKLDVTLAQPLVDRAALDEMGDVIRRAIDRCAALIEALLLLARAQAGVQRTTVALDELVIASLDELDQAIASEGLSVVTSLAPCSVQGDKVLLEHVVWNLLDNAIKYNVAGGWIRVETIAEPMTLVRISNPGPEMDGSSTEDLFVPLHRGGADRLHDREGFGLGLAIVKAVADDLGGWARADALVGGGLAITVALPSAQCRQEPLSCGTVASERRFTEA